MDIRDFYFFEPFYLTVDMKIHQKNGRYLYIYNGNMIFFITTKKIAVKL